MNILTRCDFVITQSLRLFGLAFFLITIPLLGHSDFPLPIGNFVLPASQQPGPLFSFGQNIIDKDARLIYDSPVYFRGQNDRIVFINGIYFLYGLTDNASLLVLFNVPAINKDNNIRSSGFADTVFQGEYAFYNKQTSNSNLQFTAVGSIFFPSGIMDAVREAPDVSPPNPFTGNGSFSFFLGGTTSYITFDWYLFASIGHLFTTTRHETKAGSTTFYQAGIGYNLHYFTDKILLLIFEMDASCNKRDVLFGNININSGGNSIYIGPSLFFSTEHLIFQIGIQAPVYQNLFGTQNKFSYCFSASLAWKL